MSVTDMDPRLSDAVRAELSAIGTSHSRLQRQQRHLRLVTVGIGALVLATAIMGAAIVVNSLPGTTTTLPFGLVVTATHTGTAAVDLGPVPTDAGAVVLEVTCLSSRGSISIPTVAQEPGGSGDFATFYCTSDNKPWHMSDGLLPSNGGTFITITADPDTRWSVTAQYASTSTSPWGVNERGESYGVCNARGCPDLMAVQVVRGQQGYISAKEETALAQGPGSGYLKVYASDGTTVIGRFAIGNAAP